MAKYTTQVRSIVESGHPLFDFDYPIFDEKYRNVLETKIINHYYFREIGLETVAQFKHFLKARLNLIMPYYNQLYMTEGLITVKDYNINLDNRITKTTKTNTETSGKADSKNESSANSSQNTSGSIDTDTSGTQNTDRTENETGQDIFSDTPQARLQGGDYATNVTDRERSNISGDTTTESGSVNTNTTDETTANSSGNEVGSMTNSGTLNTIEEYTEHLLGNGSMRYNADILMEWRKSFLNIDEQIIDDLRDLFMNIY